MIPERKVGFWFSEKKKKKLSCQQLAIALKFVFIYFNLKMVPKKSRFLQCKHFYNSSYFFWCHLELY